MSADNEVFAFTLLSRGIIEYDIKNKIIGLALIHWEFDITQADKYVVSDVINYVIDKL